MSGQVLHVDFISLSTDAGPEGREPLIAAAEELSTVTQVITLGVIEADAGSDFDLAFYFLLPDLESLERFGTDTRYAAFLQREAAPRLNRFAGADVRLESDYAARGSSAACLALMAPDETFDWEIREALQAWTQASEAGTANSGLAVGERPLYRGLALVFGETLAPAQRPAGKFTSTLVAGRARALP